MIVDLLNVTDEPLTFDFQIAPNDIDLDTEGVQLAGNVEINGELRKNVAKTDVRGSVKAPLKIACTRCLTPVERELGIVFQVDFVGKDMFPESKETHLESSDLDTDVLDGNQLDLEQLAREQILLNLPEQ